MVVDLYEPQYLALIVFSGFVALSFVVYTFSAFGIQEKSYEQAVAEQRARLEKEQLQQREVKRLKRKPFFEKKKREREKQDSSPGILQQEVEQAIDPYVEEPEQALPPPPVEKPKPEKVKPSPKKPKQPKAPKQVLVEETILEAKQASVQEAAPPPLPPQKESQSTRSKAHKVVEEQISKRDAPVVAIAAPVSHSPRQDQPSPAKTKSKSKPASGDGDTPALRGKTLITAVRNAPLKDAEIQQLIEILLNRQGGSASADDWVKANQRNDPVSALKKQLQEKEQALHNEILLAQAASQKVKELRHELNHQKEHTSAVEGQYKLKLESQAREIEAFHVRMQQSHESHSRENQALQGRIQQMQAHVDESSADAVAQLREENQRLKSEAGHAAQQKEQLMGQELARLQAELQKMQGKLGANEGQLRQGEELRRSLETQLNQYKQQKSQFDAGQRESESVLSKRLMEVGEELQKSQSQNQSLAQALEASRGDADSLKGQVSELRRIDGDRNTALQTVQAKLKESECQCQNLEGKVKTAEGQLAEKEKQKAKATEELEALRKEKDSLQEMLRTREKRSEAEGQESPPSTNGDVDHTDSTPKEETILLKEHNNLLADKSKTIEGLEEQLNSSRTELTKLQAVVEQQKQRNTNLREKNRKLMEVVSSAEKSRAENHEHAAKATKGELESAIAEEQSSVKKVLEKLFPTVSLQSSLSHKDWLSKFEEQAGQVLDDQSSTNSQVEEFVLKINTLEAEKDQLSSQCQHYQAVLSDTEGMVNKLQQSVETEEERFKGRIHTLEVEKQSLSSRCQELQARITEAEKTQGAAQSSVNLERVSRLEGENQELRSSNQELSAKVGTLETKVPKMQELEKEKAQLLAQCQHYQVVLRETEGILNKLQSSVESEEVKWEDRLKHTESSLDQAKSEVMTLEEELASLSSSESKKNSENSRLASELEAAQSTIDSLRQDHEAAAANYEATSHELVELKKQLHKLKEELEAANQKVEQNTDRESESAEAKSKLSASEDEVKRLAAELEKSRTSAGSGDEVNAIKKQLADAQTQLEAAEKASQAAQQEVSSLKEQLAKAPATGASDGAELAKVQEALAKAEEQRAAQQKELTTLSDSLKKEKGLTLDLGKAAAKLQVMLKKTQSALNTEKETVAKLKMQNGAAKEGAQGSTSLTESQVELQLAEAANEEVP